MELAFLFPLGGIHQQASGQVQTDEVVLDSSFVDSIHIVFQMGEAGGQRILLLFAGLYGTLHGVVCVYAEPTDCWQQVGNGAFEMLFADIYLAYLY